MRGSWEWLRSDVMRSVRGALGAWCGRSWAPRSSCGRGVVVVVVVVVEVVLVVGVVVVDELQT